MLSAEGGFPWLQCCLAFNTVVYLIRTWLDARQRREFERKRAYNVAKLQYARANCLWDFLLNSALLWAGFLPWSWRLAGAALSAAGLSGEVLQSVAWALIQSSATLLLGLPWSAYSTFVLEARHGFNNTTPATFLMDTLKTLLLGAALLPPVVAGFTAILQRASPWVGLQLWGFLLSLSLFMITLYPLAIAPLFNKFQPLEEGPLREAIEALAASLSFPLKKLFVIDGSRRSAHSNAYQYGFGGNKRVVLYDTLIQQCSQEQCVAVLAHELGHWKLGHMLRLLMAHQLVTLAQCLLFTLVRTTPGLFASFGFAPGERPALGAFLLFNYIIGPVDEVLGWLSNVVSRRFEFQADAFAVQLGKGPALREALCTLDKENKGAVTTDPLYSSYHHSHPPLLERLAAIDAAMQARKKKGE